MDSSMGTNMMPEGVKPPLTERSCRWCEYPVPEGMGVQMDAQRGQSRVMHENPCFWKVAELGYLKGPLVRERPAEERSCDCEPATDAEQDGDFNVDGPTDPA